MRRRLAGRLAVDPGRAVGLGAAGDLRVQAAAGRTVAAAAMQVDFIARYVRQAAFRLADHPAAPTTPTFRLGGSRLVAASIFLCSELEIELGDRTMARACRARPVRIGRALDVPSQLFEFVGIGVTPASATRRRPKEGGFTNSTTNYPKGAYRSRTGVPGFADLCLTTRPRRHHVPGRRRLPGPCVRTVPPASHTERRARNVMESNDERRRLRKGLRRGTRPRARTSRRGSPACRSRVPRPRARGGRSGCPCS